METCVNRENFRTTKKANTFITFFFTYFVFFKDKLFVDKKREDYRFLRRFFISQHLRFFRPTSTLINL